MFALTVDPVNSGLEVLNVGIFKSGIDVVFVIAIAIQISL